MLFNKEFQHRVKEHIEHWDTVHPIDLLWRRQFNIPFGSKQHLEVDFIDQLIWYEEEKYVRKLQDEYKRTGKLGEESSISQGGSDIVELSQEEIEEKFSELTKNL